MSASGAGRRLWRPLAVNYLVLAVAVLVSLGGFLAMMHQAGLKRQDLRTQTVAYDIENKLANYIEAKQRVPATLAEAGVKSVPPTISYSKLGRGTYRFCATYRSGYVYAYHPGRNCQVNNAYTDGQIQSWVKNGDGTYTVCGVRTNYFDAEGQIVPPTINTPNVVDVNNELFIFSATSKAFDEKCNQLAQTDLHVGNKVDVFDITSSGGRPVSAVSIFLKRS